MTPALADRLSRAVVGCYPRRWKQRYAAELLDVLDQHHAGPRTVLSLAGGALGTHLDPACCAAWPPPRSCRTTRARCRTA
jgi:hypothetical protein